MSTANDPTDFDDMLRANPKIRHFASHVFSAEWHNEFCAPTPQFNKRWTSPDSLCYVFHVGLEIVRVEVLSWKPPLVVFRNVFNKIQIGNSLRIMRVQKIINRAILNFGKQEESPLCPNEGVLIDNEHPMSLSLTESISGLIPTLDFSTIGDICVHTHDINSPSKCAHDCPVSTEEQGACFASFIIVMETATQGGGIFFHFVQSVKADPGDVVMWLNIGVSSCRVKFEPDALYGYCPIYESHDIFFKACLWSKGHHLFETTCNENFGQSFTAALFLPDNILK